MSSGTPAYPYWAIASSQAPSQACRASTSLAPPPVIHPSTATPTSRTARYTPAGASAVSTRASGGAVTPAPAGALSSTVAGIAVTAEGYAGAAKGPESRRNGCLMVEVSWTSVAEPVGAGIRSR